MSVFAMPYWIHNAERLQHGSEEIMRVLKDDGYASLYPIAPPRIDTTVQKRVMEDTIISLGGKFAVHKYDRRERIQIQAR
jgi:hypothetical protein